MNTATTLQEYNNIKNSNSTSTEELIDMEVFNLQDSNANISSQLKNQKLDQALWGNLSMYLNSPSKKSDATSVKVNKDTIKLEKERYIVIESERFNLEIIKDKYILSHPKWSLYGDGSNLLEAENNLRNEAKEVFEILVSNKNLDLETNNMLDFIIKLF